MIRAVASVPGLPLVVLRRAYAYGPGETHGEVTKTILLGLVYKHLEEDMKFLWAPKLKKHTVHTRDVVGAAWTAAEWAAGLDRAQIDKLAGVSLLPSGDESVKGVPGAIQKEQGGVITPVFNLVDDSDSNQENTGEVIAKVRLLLSNLQIETNIFTGVRHQVWLPRKHCKPAREAQIRKRRRRRE